MVTVYVKKNIMGINAVKNAKVVIFKDVGMILESVSTIFAQIDSMILEHVIAHVVKIAEMKGHAIYSLGNAVYAMEINGARIAKKIVRKDVIPTQESIVVM
jgi:hypothetical protein